LFAELISSTLKMEAICSSETSVDTQRITRRYIPEDDTLHPVVQIVVFRIMTPCNFVDGFQRFREVCCLHPMNRRL
jgi:hypothetical protein